MAGELLGQVSGSQAHAEPRPLPRPQAEGSSSAGTPPIYSVILQGHEGAPSDHLFTISPKQVVSGVGLGASGNIPLTKAGVGGMCVQH